MGAGAPHGRARSGADAIARRRGGARAGGDARPGGRARQPRPERGIRGEDPPAQSERLHEPRRPRHADRVPHRALGRASRRHLFVPHEAALAARPASWVLLAVSALYLLVALPLTLKAPPI